MYKKKDNEKNKVNAPLIYRKIIHYDDVNIIKIYDTAKEAAKDLNLCASSISKCCKGNRKMCGNKTFKYLDQTDDIKNMKISAQNQDLKVGKIIPPSLLYRKINVHDKEGKIIEICNSKAEVVRKYKVNIDTVTKHCLGKTKYSHIDYKFSYA